MFHNDHKSPTELAAIADRWQNQQQRLRGVPGLIHGKPLRRLQRSFEMLLHHYPYPNLFIAGLPKSGTTWLERLLTTVPGYHKWIPGYIPDTGHDLLPDTFRYLPPGYTVTRVHTQPRPDNIRIIHAANRPYAIMVRDLRDVAVSYFFYARNHETVLLHKEAVQADDFEAFLPIFSRTLLPDYIAWCTGWLERRDPARSLLVKYESLLADTTEVFTDILTHFGIELPASDVARIVQAHSFSNTTGGRQPGEEDAASFNRKGVAGDWRRHFSQASLTAFHQQAGDCLQALGYPLNAPELSRAV